MTARKGESLTLDLRSSSVVYLNDLETDKRYSRWPASLFSILQPAPMGQLRALRKNLFTLVAVIDPLAPETPQLLAALREIIERPLPVRVGVLWTTSSGQQQLRDAKASFQTLNEKATLPPLPETAVDALLVRAFDAARTADASGALGALKWLLSLYGAPRDELTIERIRSAFVAKYSAEVWVRYRKRQSSMAILLHLTHL